MVVFRYFSWPHRSPQAEASWSFPTIPGNSYRVLRFIAHKTKTMVPRYNVSTCTVIVNIIEIGMRVIVAAIIIVVIVISYNL